MSSKNSVGQIIKAFVAVGTLRALACRFGVIKAALDNLCGLTSWARDAVWPTQISDGLITLHIIDQFRDIDLQGRTPVMGWKWDVMSLHYPHIHDPGIQHEPAVPDLVNCLLGQQVGIEP